MTEVPAIVVDISDDDNSCTFVENTPVETNSSEKCSKSMSKELIESLVLDEENTSKHVEDDVIEILDTPSKKQETFINSLEISLDFLSNKDNLLIKFIKKCLEIEDSIGMKSVINKTLKPIYENTDETFLNSFNFENVIKRTMRNLESDPGRRFTYINFLIGVLKEHKKRKRIEPITLSSETTNGKINPKINRCFAEDNNNTKKTKRKKVSDKSNEKCKKQKVTVIDVDEYNEKHLKNIENNDDDDVVILNDEKENKNSENSNSNKEYLIPKLVEVYSDDDAVKINELEKKIKIYQNKIAALEEREVINDNYKSPYILCDSFKSKIVELYKGICRIKGADPVKRREIRLQVADHHPAGPARCLENFINSNIGSDGDPPFPDFTDVVTCVFQANKEDNLGWNKAQILNEANALFTQCGRALQKRRQKREWKDILRKVKLEVCDDDPAEGDPELMAKLEENRRLAEKKEADILQRYSSLQAEMFAKRSKPTNSKVTNEPPAVSLQAASRDSDSNTDAKEKKDGLSEAKPKTMSKLHSNGDKLKPEAKQDVSRSADTGERVEIEVKSSQIRPEVPNDNSVNKNLIEKESEIEDANMQCDGLNGVRIVKTEHLPSLDLESKIDSSTKRNIIKFEEDIEAESSVSDVDRNNFESVVKNTCVSEDDTVSSSSREPTLSEVNIKKEPDIDLIKLLEGLGDDFTTTIIEIEDPFLIIEISDSSSEED